MLLLLLRVSVHVTISPQITSEKNLYRNLPYLSHVRRDLYLSFASLVCLLRKP